MMVKPTNSFLSKQTVESLGCVHFIGICGKGMSSVALALAAHGVKVRGSDNGQTYGGTLELLKEAGIDVWDGFDASQIDGADHIVMGRQYGRGNPEVEAALERGVPYFSMPEFLLQFFFRYTRNAVIAGTKGKTTTTAMLSWILEQAGVEPGFMLGGIFKDRMCPPRLAASGINVIEGDDYDTLYWDHNPKFAYYRPDAIILTNVYKDHPEVHITEEGEIANFKVLISQLPKNGLLLVGAGNEATLKAASFAPCKIQCVRFADDDDVKNNTKDTDVIIVDWSQTGDISQFKVEGVKFELPLIGRYNAVNATLAAKAAERYGVALADSARYLCDFHGVYGRQDMLIHKNGIRIYADIAYLPESLDMVRDSFRLKHPESRQVLIYQPFIVNAMEGKDRELAEVMQSFDLVLLTDVYKPQLGAPTNPEFTGKLKSYLEAKGTHVVCTGDVGDCVKGLLPHLQKGDTVLCILHPKCYDSLSPMMTQLAESEA